MVFCQKLGKQAEGLPYPPYPGEHGKKVYEHISKEAWLLWTDHQTKLINEYRLNPLDTSAKSFLEQSMLDFLFNNQIKSTCADLDKPSL